MADCIHTHLAEEGFDLEQLSGHLNVSKSTLHRKVKAMTGLTPLEFIRNIKLKYAYNANDNFLHTCVKLLENLNCTFLGNLCNTFHKLFTFH